LDSRLQLGNHARPHPGDGALADAEHVGDHRLALALDQEPHQLPLPRIEARHRLLEHLILLVVRFITRLAVRGGAGPLGQPRRDDVVERGERGLPPGLPSAPPGDVDGPVMGEPLEKGTAVVGGGAAARVEAGHRRLPGHRTGQPTQVVEDESQGVVACRRIADAPLAEHTTDDDRHDWLGRTDQVFERGMTARRLPLAEQRREIVSLRTRTLRIYKGDLIHEHAILW
jgi:hypothetical protein